MSRWKITGGRRTCFCGSPGALLAHSVGATWRNYASAIKNSRRATPRSCRSPVALQRRPNCIFGNTSSHFLTCVIRNEAYSLCTAFVLHARRLGSSLLTWRPIWQLWLVIACCTGKSLPLHCRISNGTARSTWSSKPSFSSIKPGSFATCTPLVLLAAFRLAPNTYVSLIVSSDDEAFDYARKKINGCDEPQPQI